MLRRSQTRYSSQRNRRRRLLATASVVLCVCLVCAAALAFTNLNLPWTTASGEESPVEGNLVEDTTEGTVANTVEASSVEKTSEERADLPLPEESCNDPRVLVGKNHALPPDYAPRDLTSLIAYGVPTYGGEQLVRQATVKPLSELISEANAEGHELLVLSAFRSYAEQQQNFAHFTGIYGDDAEIVSAPPGQSQHQLGTTVDFTNAEVGYQLLPAFGQTAASKWLEANAWRHGFIITYPDGDEQGTGRQHEPWEYRFVGEELAGEIHDSDMSLREFLTEEGVRPRC